MACAILIGVALLDQIFDHRDHLRDIPRGARHVIWLQRAKCAHVLEVPASLLIDSFDKAIHAGDVRNVFHHLQSNGGADHLRVRHLRRLNIDQPDGFATFVG